MARLADLTDPAEIAGVREALTVAGVQCMSWAAEANDDDEEAAWLASTDRFTTLLNELPEHGRSAGQAPGEGGDGE